LNGSDNENNSFRPLDLNGNILKTSTGDLTIDASASATTGAVNITAKSGGSINLNSNVVMDNSESFVQRNPAFTIYNNQTTTSISLVDISVGGLDNQNINTNISQSLTNETSIQKVENLSTSSLQRISRLDKTTSITTEQTDINTGSINITDNNNPSSTETANITSTYIQFTTSGSQNDSLAMYNDSADGGEIDWSNVSGTNGLAITSSHSLTLKATASTFPLQFDSDVINLLNTNTTTSTANNFGTLATTSAIGDITNYLKLQLNGADIWIPYFTTDPSV
jgi:hypothetical protein